MKRKLTTLSLLVLLVASLSITGILAYFTAQDLKENNATIGNNEIKINEVFNNSDIEPNKVTEIEKRVSLENIGKNPAGLRVRIEFSSSSVEEWASIEYNTTSWTKSGDYWYYKTPLLPGEETEPLFEKLTCNNPTAEQVADFEVYIYSESRDCEEETDINGIMALFN